MDVDILTAMKPSTLDRVSTTHGGSCACDTAHDEEAVSFESWDEVLDFPSGTLVVRAKGNTLARLAVTAVLTQLHSEKSKKQSQIIRICPPKDAMCIHCYLKMSKLPVAQVKAVLEPISKMNLPTWNTETFPGVLIISASCEVGVVDQTADLSTVYAS